MKSIFFIAALAISGVAFAQTSTTTTTTASEGTTVAPDNSTPKTDARGIAVISAPATAPPGFNQPPQVGGTGASPSAPPAPQPATEDYPVCSRTVTDNCVQAYERGAGRPR